jgi:hypothetical protein
MNYKHIDNMTIEEVIFYGQRLKYHLLPKAKEYVKIAPVHEVIGIMETIVKGEVMVEKLRQKYITWTHSQQP